MITVRKALQSDRDEVLSFCRGTFSWGDYIEQVWDLWVSSSDGQLLVAEQDGGAKVGIGHAAICPRSRIVWLEGIRVHPSWRRSRVATELVSEMLRYGTRNGCRSAQAVVARDNVPSQTLMEKCGFSVISEWLYHSVSHRSFLKEAPSAHPAVRFASKSDVKAIMDYLAKSRIYRLSAKRYVESWRWYPLDAHAVKQLVSRGRIIISVNSTVDGLAVVNSSGYWDRRDVMQIVYLDSSSVSVVRDILAFVKNIIAGQRGYRWLHVIFQRNRKIAGVVKEFRIGESEQFLLYSKVFSG
jgi:GNAT superfamily N-acetyltransferase